MLPQTNMRFKFCGFLEKVCCQCHQVIYIKVITVIKKQQEMGWG